MAVTVSYLFWPFGFVLRLVVRCLSSLGTGCKFGIVVAKGCGEGSDMRFSMPKRQENGVQTLKHYSGSTLLRIRVPRLKGGGLKGCFMKIMLTTPTPNICENMPP